MSTCAILAIWFFANTSSSYFLTIICINEYTDIVYFTKENVVLFMGFSFVILESYNVPTYKY